MKTVVRKMFLLMPDIDRFSYFSIVNKSHEKTETNEGHVKTHQYQMWIHPPLKIVPDKCTIFLLIE